MSLLSNRTRLESVPQPSVPEDLTVAQYLNEWLEGKQSLRPSTRLSYTTHVRLYLTPHLGEVILSDLRPLHIHRMYSNITARNGDRQRPISVTTLRRIHGTLMSAMNTAVRRGLIDRNPASTVELPRVIQPRVEVWSANELGQFLAATQDDRLHLMYLVLGLRGLRRGEAVGLRWCDIDLDRGVLRIERSAVRVQGVTVMGAPKSASGCRAVAIDRTTARLMHLHGCQQRLESFMAHGRVVVADLVFTTPQGAPIDPTYVSRHFDRLIKMHGLPRIRLHDLRHTSASIGLASGETLFEVSRRLGHSSITVTADIYSHISPVVAHESAERLAQQVFQP
jgi:integrase